MVLLMLFGYKTSILSWMIHKCFVFQMVNELNSVPNQESYLKFLTLIKPLQPLLVGAAWYGFLRMLFLGRSLYKATLRKINCFRNNNNKTFWNLLSKIVLEKDTNILKNSVKKS